MTAASYAAHPLQHPSAQARNASGLLWRFVAWRHFLTATLILPMEL